MVTSSWRISEAERGDGDLTPGASPKRRGEMVTSSWRISEAERGDGDLTPGASPKRRGEMGLMGKWGRVWERNDAKTGNGVEGKSCKLRRDRGTYARGGWEKRASGRKV